MFTFSHDVVGKCRREVGIAGDYAGHHCSWCFKTPDEVRTKLISQNLADGPRYGRMKEKLDLDYIKRLTETGEWFDGTKPTREVNSDEIKDFAPKYVLEYWKKYEYLLKRGTDSSINRTTT